MLKYFLLTNSVLNNRVYFQVLIYLFKYLPHSDRIAASQTCKLWYEAGSDKSLLSKPVVKFTRIPLQNDSYPCNIFGPNAFHKYVNFSFEELDISSHQMSHFWKENGHRIKKMEFIRCEMHEKGLINILNQCSNLEKLTINYCKELFMSARLFENLKPESLKNLKELNLPSNRYLSDALFHRISSSSSSVRALDLSDCPLSFHPGLYKKFYPSGETQSPSENVLTFLSIFKFLKSNARNITKLVFNQTLIDGDALESISQLPDMKLTHLYLHRCDQLNVDGIMCLSLNQHHLVKLDIGRNSRITNEALLSICSNLINLKFLCVNGCKEISDAGIAELWNLKKLESVDISVSNNITTQGLKTALCREINYQLLELDISGIDLEESAIILISEMLPNLRMLNMNSCFAAVTDNSIQSIFKNLLQLRTLYMYKIRQASDVGFTGMGVGNQVPINPKTTAGGDDEDDIFYGQNPHKISLRSRAEEEIVRDARRKQDVKVLCENFTDGTERGYGIDRLKNLVVLDVSACNRLTDVSLKYAFAFKSLKTLNLSECQQITHEGLQHVAENCPSLEVVDLWNCFNTRDEGVKVLVTKLQRLKHLNLNVSIVI